MVQHHPDYMAHIKSSSVIKLLLIGDAGVGKSALIISYCDDVFEESNLKTTVGVDLKVKVVNVDGSYFKTVIWDTAGQERYRNVIPSLYKGTNGVLLTYDVTDRSSFEGLYHWIQECYENCDLSRTIFYIVGNKLDQDGRQIEKEDIKKLLAFIKKNYANFRVSAVFEVSAKYPTLVYGLFDRVIKDLVENRCYFDETRLRNKKSIDLSVARDEQQRNCCSY
jgi:GTP-binding protein YPT11